MRRRSKIRISSQWIVVIMMLCLLIVGGMGAWIWIQGKEEYLSKAVMSTQIGAQQTIDKKDETDASETIAPSSLYAKSAVLMDADSGRVLYEKNGYEVLPMASTTKILTCIVALEHGNLSDEVSVSHYAASMPDVQLHIREDETYRLEDLLYSLMLESHNDTAVAIAEHIGGTVEGFARMMNQTAKEIGCCDSCFLTPNGLDATAASKDGSITYSHGTTAAELAKIMAYCVKRSPHREEFLTITQTPSYSFTDGTGKRQFHCSNHNAFLNMMEGVISGKTGFTGKAGYCYVGALEQDGKTFTIALLACGWPNHKSYKWSDARILLEYGLEAYEYRRFDSERIPKEALYPVKIKNGQTEHIGEQAVVQPAIQTANKSDKLLEGMLMRAQEQIVVTYEPEGTKQRQAPVKQGTKLGNLIYTVDGTPRLVLAVVADRDVKEITYRWCIQQIKDLYLFKKAG
ncbi:MAG: D-alanyl-D-alanine carboxypeptidase family protein [Lachnospiraceae bacterium]